MCITANNMFMNYGCGTMGGYQYGMNIADMFTGVPGINTVWNFGGLGCSNLGYGFGSGCCGMSSSWTAGNIVGNVITTVLGIAGMSYVSAKSNAAKTATTQTTSVKDQLETQRKILGIKESVDSLTEAGIDSVSLTKPVKDKIYAKYNELSRQKTAAEATYSAAALKDLTPAGCIATTIEGLITAWTDIKNANAQGVENRDATKYSNACDMIGKLNKLAETKKSWESGGANYEKLEKERIAAETEEEKQNNKLAEAKTKAKALLRQYNAEKAAQQAEAARAAQAKKEKEEYDLYNDADGTAAKRLLTKSSVSINGNGNVTMPADATISAGDCMDVIHAFRTAKTAGEKKNIQDWVKANIEAIKKAAEDPKSEISGTMLKSFETILSTQLA